MFNVGDSFVVKSNGLKGRIIGRHVPGYSGNGSYEVEWDHIPGKFHFYDIKDVHDSNDWEVVPKLFSGNRISSDYTHLDLHGFPDFNFAGMDLSSCDHKWKEYHGFSDSFKYCEKCDKKERLNE